jgi:hypothetical protein
MSGTRGVSSMGTGWRGTRQTVDAIQTLLDRFEVVKRSPRVVVECGRREEEREAREEK